MSGTDRFKVRLARPDDKEELTNLIHLSARGLSTGVYAQQGLV